MTTRMMLARNWVILGELALVVCCVTYLAWWLIAFRPYQVDYTRSRWLVGISIFLGFFSVLVFGIVLIVLDERAAGPPLGVVLLGGVITFLVLYVGTGLLFRRVLTTELPILVLWATMQLAVLRVLGGYDLLSPGAVNLWIGLVVFSTIVAVVCYVAYERVEETVSYWIGTVPFIVNVILGAFFVVQLAVGA